MKGQIHIYTGDGKGKSTASLGLLIRAFGAGLKCGIIYFDKGGNDYNERTVLKQLNIPFFVTGLNRIEENGKFRFSITKGDIFEAKRGLKILKELFDEKYDLIVCDEINSTTALKMLDEKEVIDIIKQKPEQTEIILTGRNAPQSFIELANLVTEMKLHKHYFYQGIESRKGIEY